MFCFFVVFFLGLRGVAGGCAGLSLSQCGNTQCCAGSGSVEYCQWTGSKCVCRCDIAAWTDWSTCITECVDGVGSGTQTRTRIASPCCPNAEETQSCTPGCCPIQCVLSGWSEWVPCSPCGGGDMHRSRSVLTQPMCGAPTCPTELYQMSPCPPYVVSDCVLSGWSEWSDCTVSCGMGSQTRTRSVTAQACSGQCGSTNESRGCTLGNCPLPPVHCAVSGWSTWTACSESCGPNGTRQRSRAILLLAANGGAPCPPDLSESEPCNEAVCCPVACVVANWANWASCSASCGPGTRQRTRAVTTGAACNGAACPSLTEGEACNAASCPIDCVVSPFTQWSTCSQLCGSGEERRTRSIVTPAQFGGMACPAASTLSETRPCMLAPCACVVSPWSAYSTCSATCGTGTMTRTRTITTRTPDCPPLVEIVECNLSACGSDCVLGMWGSWSTCSAMCGGGTFQRTRAIAAEATGNGAACPGPSGLTESGPCNPQCCVATCSVAAWSAWSACSTTCGSGGDRSRSRAITIPPACGAAACPELLQTEACSSAMACPVACQLSAWSDWGTCTQTCGAGEERRTRTVAVQPVAGGAACGAMSESRVCSKPPCSCQVSMWATWTPCSATCGPGMQTRTRVVTASASDCPALSESIMCTSAPCAVDCLVSSWSAWSACSASCGGGLRSQTRMVTQSSVGSGAACMPLQQSENCNEQPCVTAGLPCSEYRNCADCVDTGKTAPRQCQFCAPLLGSVGVGVCQSKFQVDGNSSSGPTVCSVGFTALTTGAMCCPDCASDTKTSAASETIADSNATVPLGSESPAAGGLDALAIGLIVGAIALACMLAIAVAVFRKRRSSSINELDVVPPARANIYAFMPPLGEAPVGLFASAPAAQSAPLYNSIGAGQLIDYHSARGPARGNVYDSPDSPLRF